MRKNSGLIILLALCLAFLNGYSNSPADTTKTPVRKGYRKIMKLIFNDLATGYNISDSIMTWLIPESQAEYLVFDSLSTPNDSAPALKAGSYVYKSMLGKKLNTQDKKLYKKYMYLSEFVFGDYASTYYRVLDQLLAQDMPMFCAFYRKENSTRLNHLQRYADKCK